jgi:hypothetical protein
MALHFSHSFGFSVFGTRDKTTAVATAQAYFEKIKKNFQKSGILMPKLTKRRKSGQMGEITEDLGRA